MYPVDIRSDVMVSLTAPHTSPLYATAVVENFAGLRSVFHSRMIVVDHTPPVIEGVQVVAEMKYDFIDMKNKSALLKLNVTWNVQDEESGIQVCFISVGMFISFFTICNLHLGVKLIQLSSGLRRS